MRDTNDRFVMVSTEDGYDASRLVLPVFRKRILTALGPSVGAAVPARDRLVCWSAASKDQEAFVRVAEQDYEIMPHPITPQIFAFTEDGVFRSGLEPLSKDKP